MKPVILLLGAAAAGVLAVPTPDEYAIHERRDFVPALWAEGKRLDGSKSLPVRIGLTQSNLGHGHELLMEMYVGQLRNCPIEN